LLVWFGLSISSEDKLPAVGGREMHIEHLHGAELIQRLAGREARCFESKPVLQGDLNAVGKESDEDVGFDAVFALMIDRPHRQIALAGSVSLMFERKR
jgi:hypothetical protein